MDNSQQKLRIGCFQSSVSTPQVTIVVVPRERFSYTRQALESLYDHTHIPFALVYVDGNSPNQVRRYLQTQAKEKKFTLVRSERYLAPNQARNIGLSYVKTKYLVFVDNDVVFTPGWLKKLVDCAEQTEATIVAPLTCIGKPVHQTVHFAGGKARIVVETQGEDTVRKVQEEHYYPNCPLAEVRKHLKRERCELAEFHCMLVRHNIFEQIGLLDDRLLNTKENLDLSLTVTQVGGKIYCEPSSIVTYVTGKIEWSDLPFFCLRWSDEWELASLQYFCEKWNLTKQDQYLHKEKRLGNRRYQALLRPIVRDLSFGNTNTWLENRLKPLERSLNHYFIRRHKDNLIGAK
ncbi:MAG: glycosyltransferase family 2 protein [Xenococcaceae cyanobacterium]